MKKHGGFTLIELVAVLVILALLGAMAVPRFVDMSQNALTAAQNGSIAAVRTGHAMAIAQLRALPRLNQLINFVGGQQVSMNPGGTGIDVVINNQTYTIGTYTDTTCQTATSAATDTVGCVGGIL